MNEEPEKLEDIEVEIPNDVDAIYAADIAYRLSMEIDGQLHSKAFQARLRRIQRNSLFIIDKALQYLKEPYDTPEDKDIEDDDD